MLLLRSVGFPRISLKRKAAPPSVQAPPGNSKFQVNPAKFLGCHFCDWGVSVAGCSFICWRGTDSMSLAL